MFAENEAVSFNLASSFFSNIDEKLIQYHESGEDLKYFIETKLTDVDIHFVCGDLVRTRARMMHAKPEGLLSLLKVLLSYDRTRCLCLATLIELMRTQQLGSQSAFRALSEIHVTLCNFARQKHIFASSVFTLHIKHLVESVLIHLDQGEESEGVLTIIELLPTAISVAKYIDREEQDWINEQQLKATALMYDQEDDEDDDEEERPSSKQTDEIAPEDNDYNGDPREASSEESSPSVLRIVIDMILKAKWCSRFFLALLNIFVEAHTIEEEFRDALVNKVIEGITYLDKSDKVGLIKLLLRLTYRSNASEYIHAIRHTFHSWFMDSGNLPNIYFVIESEFIYSNVLIKLLISTLEDTYNGFGTVKESRDVTPDGILCDTVLLILASSNTTMKDEISQTFSQFILCISNNEKSWGSTFKAAINRYKMQMAASSSNVIPIPPTFVEKVLAAVCAECIAQNLLAVCYDWCQHPNKNLQTIGEKTLVSIFERCKASRLSVLHTIFDAISEDPKISQKLLYVKIIGTIARYYSMQLLDVNSGIIPRIQEWLNYCSTFPQEVGQKLLEIFLKIPNPPASLQSFFHTLLRKMLSSKVTESIRLAIIGFCTMLGSGNVGSHQLQSQEAVVEISDDQTNIVQLLMKAQEFHHSLRKTLYASLVKMLLAQPRCLSELCLEALLQHILGRLNDFIFNDQFEGDSNLGSSHFNFLGCIEVIKATNENVIREKEPIADLFKIAFLLHSLMRSAGYTSSPHYQSAGNICQAVLTDLKSLKRMIYLLELKEVNEQVPTRKKGKQRAKRVTPPEILSNVYFGQRIQLCLPIYDAFLEALTHGWIETQENRQTKLELLEVNAFMVRLSSALCKLKKIKFTFSPSLDVAAGVALLRQLQDTFKRAVPKITYIYQEGENDDDIAEEDDEEEETTIKHVALISVQQIVLSFDSILKATPNLNFEFAIGDVVVEHEDTKVARALVEALRLSTQLLASMVRLTNCDEGRMTKSSVRMLNSSSLLTEADNGSPEMGKAVKVLTADNQYKKLLEETRLQLLGFIHPMIELLPSLTLPTGEVHYSLAEIVSPLFQTNPTEELSITVPMIAEKFCELLIDEIPTATLPVQFFKHYTRIVTSFISKCSSLDFKNSEEADRIRDKMIEVLTEYEIKKPTIIKFILKLAFSISTEKNAVRLARRVIDICLLESRKRTGELVDDSEEYYQLKVCLNDACMSTSVETVIQLYSNLLAEKSDELHQHVHRNKEDREKELDTKLSSNDDYFFLPFLDLFDFLVSKKIAVAEKLLDFKGSKVKQALILLCKHMMLISKLYITTFGRLHENEHLVSAFKRKCAQYLQVAKIMAAIRKQQGFMLSGAEDNSTTSPYTKKIKTFILTSENFVEQAKKMHRKYTKACKQYQSKNAKSMKKRSQSSSMTMDDIPELTKLAHTDIDTLLNTEEENQKVRKKLNTLKENATTSAALKRSYLQFTEQPAKPTSKRRRPNKPLRSRISYIDSGLAELGDNEDDFADLEEFLVDQA